MYRDSGKYVVLVRPVIWGAKIVRSMAQCDKALLRLNGKLEHFHSERDVGTVLFRDPQSTLDQAFKYMVRIINYSFN